MELGTTDRELTTLLRLHEMNRGVLLVPFVSNVALISPDVQPADVDRHTEVLEDALRLLSA
jgi:glutamate-1-semialdehyde aminotransferase